jgi:4-hydroxyphenylacetate 3-monooxygenase
MMGTSSIMANEVFVANLQPLKPGEEPLAFSCALEMNTKGQTGTGAILRSRR